ncbi:hypothetical protein ACFPZ4_31085, partial [Micromonospora harpali]
MAARVGAAGRAGRDRRGVRIPGGDVSAPGGDGDVIAPGAGGGDLAARQAELVAALVAGGPLPAGFAPTPVDAARRALLRKRAGDVARHW